ncbi:transposase [Streptomyces sp. NPDC014773]|uniref:transposase n=1 Tax=Streptomyces sp. NPDC014773 TaxID=3364908 RepID=UPI0036FD425C
MSASRSVHRIDTSSSCDLVDGPWSAVVGRDRCDDSAVRDGVTTGPWIVDDDLWELVEPLLPAWPERSPGPRPVPDRLCLQGILFVLCDDMGWQLLPSEPGFVSGQTCRRRLYR